MTSPEDLARRRRALTREQVHRMVVDLFGFEPVAGEHEACYDDDEVTSGLLACVLAGAQWHIQARPDHAELISQAYHGARCQLGFGDCPCHPGEQSKGATP